MSSFESLGLRAELLRSIADEGYEKPTPVQAGAIPVVIAGKDLMAGAQTGTGKTAGFTLPILQRLAATKPAGKKRPIRALVLVPTRELAAQVLDSVERYGRHLPLRAIAVFGGVNINPQIRALRQGVDILVATPGRLLDHASQENLDLSRLEVLVLDEADRMLDMGFIRDIRRILALLPEKRQNLFFSATFPNEIKQLADSMLTDPELVEVARSGTTARDVSQIVYHVEQKQKRAMLSYLIGSNRWTQVLVFTRTKHGANRLAQQLEKDGLTSAAIHGNKSQGARTRALAGFKAGDVRVLVATDIAARGLDIEQLPHVVNYELPHVPEDYVHRIGRTGRAGQSGEALSLVAPEEAKQLKQIEKLLKTRLPVGEVEGFETPSNVVSIQQGEAADKAPTQKPGNGRRRRRRRSRSARTA